MSSFEILEALAFVGVLVVKMKNREIIYANKAVEKILGWGAAEIIGSPLNVIFSELAFEKFQEPLSQVEAGNFKALQSDILCRQKDGRDIYCLLSSAAGPDSLIVISVQNAENGSATDSLTRLRTRRAFFVLAEHERTMAERLKKKVFIFFIDVDGLKTVNDLMGHAAGDELLLATVDILKKSFLRESDIVVRFGGDEFVALTLGDSRGKNEILKRIRRAETQKSREMMDKRDFPVSLSIGVVRCDPKQSLQSALEQADALMYEEKKKKKEKRI